MNRSEVGVSMVGTEERRRQEGKGDRREGKGMARHVSEKDLLITT